MKAVVWLGFRMGVLDATMKVVVLGHLAGKLVQKRPAILDTREQQHFLLDTSEDRSNTRGSIYRPAPEQPFRSRFLLARGIHNRKQGTALSEAIRQQPIVDVAVAAPIGADETDLKRRAAIRNLLQHAVRL